MTDATFAREVGARIRQAREAKRLSQSAMARALGMVNQGAVSMVEAGQRGLTLDSARRWGRVLGVSVAWIVGETRVSPVTPLLDIDLGPEE